MGGLGSSGFSLGIDSLAGLFQHKLFYDSAFVILLIQLIIPFLIQLLKTNSS